MDLGDITAAVIPATPAPSTATLVRLHFPPAGELDDVAVDVAPVVHSVVVK